MLVAQQGSRVAGVAKVVAVVAFHVHSRAAQVAALNQCSHAPRYVAELIVVSDR